MIQVKARSFYRWALDKYSESRAGNTKRIFDDTPEGDFANDMYYDSKFPKNSHEFYVIQNHLRNSSACPECIETFRSLFSEYRKYIEEIHPHFRGAARSDLLEFLEEWRYNEDGDPDNNELDELADTIAWLVTHEKW